MKSHETNTRERERKKERKKEKKKEREITTKRSISPLSLNCNPLYKMKN
jgi:hypothetical protein